MLLSPTPLHHLFLLGTPPHLTVPGVTCHHNVIALDLTKLGLSGTLSGDVAHLPLFSNLSLTDTVIVLGFELRFDF